MCNSCSRFRGQTLVRSSFLILLPYPLKSQPIAKSNQIKLERVFINFCVGCFYVQYLIWARVILKAGTSIPPFWKKYLQQFGWWQAWAAFLWLRADVGRSSFRRCHPLASGPGSYKWAGWAWHVEKAISSNFVWPLSILSPDFYTGFLLWLPRVINHISCEMK